MGQAKLRGTFEQRQAEAIAKREAREQRAKEIAAKRRAELAEIEARKTPEQRADERNRRTKLGLLLAASLGVIISGSARKEDNTEWRDVPVEGI